MSPRHFDSPQELAASQGDALGPGEWFTVTQEVVNQFAEATGDRQWIHVDVERAKRESPFGGPIAHGYLTLALMGSLQPSVYTVDAGRVVNYGAERLRFVQPVPVGARIRQREVIRASEAVSGGLRVTSEVTVEIEGEERPALVASIVFLYFE